MIGVILLFAFTMSLLINLVERIILDSEDSLKTTTENEEKLVIEKTD